MVVMLVVLVALGTIAGLTVISVQGGAAQASTQRFSAMALYAAESGGAAAMSWLRTQHDPARRFTDVIGTSPPDLPGNGVAPGAPGNLLSDDQQGWYQVTLLNNPGDPGNPGTDTDSTVIIQVTGHGPNGAMRRLEWEVRRDAVAAVTALRLIGWREVL